MSSDDKAAKAERLFYEYLDFVSSPEEIESFAKENGLNLDALVKESMQKVKQFQMQFASRRTAEEFKELKASLLQRAKDQVQKLLSDASFNLESFIKQENINLAFKNFEKLSSSEIREFLERHYMLKFEAEMKNKA